MPTATPGTDAGRKWEALCEHIIAEIDRLSKNNEALSEILTQSRLETAALKEEVKTLRDELRGVKDEIKSLRKDMEPLRLDIAMQKIKISAFSGFFGILGGAVAGLVAYMIKK